MKSEEEIRVMIESTNKALPKSTPYLDGVRDALEWVLQ